MDERQVESGQSRPSRGRRLLRRPWWLLGLAAIPAIGAVLFWRAPESPVPAVIAQASRPGSPAVARRETRPTLDPERFVGKVALAYRVAREVPELLDQLYCYCGCDKLVGHKTLLSCYTDSHAAT